MKKRGFTLVELLAVIAILAILVIVSMPNIMEMFFSAKEDTFESEVTTPETPVVPAEPEEPETPGFSMIEPPPAA